MLDVASLAALPIPRFDCLHSPAEVFNNVNYRGIDSERHSRVKDRIEMVRICTVFVVAAKEHWERASRPQSVSVCDLDFQKSV